MSTHNIGFYEEISKIITSSNMHLISSADNRPDLESANFETSMISTFILQSFESK